MLPINGYLVTGAYIHYYAPVTDNHWLATYIYVVIIIMCNNMLRIMYNNTLKTV